MNFIVSFPQSGSFNILFKSGVVNNTVSFEEPVTAFRIIPSGGEKRDYLYADFINNSLYGNNETTVTSFTNEITSTGIEFLGGQRLSKLKFIGTSNQNYGSSYPFLVSGFSSNLNNLKELEFYDIANLNVNDQFFIDFTNFSGINLKSAVFSDCGYSSGSFILNNFPWSTSALTGLTLKTDAFGRVDPAWNDYAQLTGLTNFTLDYGDSLDSYISIINISTPFPALKTLNLSPSIHGFRLNNTDGLTNLETLKIYSAAFYAYNNSKINNAAGLINLKNLTIQDLGGSIDINDTASLYNLTELTLNNVGYRYNTSTIYNIEDLISLKNINLIDTYSFGIPINKLHLLPSIENILIGGIVSLHALNGGLNFTGEFLSSNTNSITFSNITPYYYTNALSNIRTSGLKDFKEINYNSVPSGSFFDYFQIVDVGGFINTPSLTISNCGGVGGLYGYCNIRDTSTLLSGVAALNIMNAVRTGNNVPGEIKLNINDAINTVDKSIYFPDVYTGLREQGFYVNLYFTSGGVTNPAIVARYSDNTQEFFKTSKIENVTGDIFNPFQIEQNVNDLFFENCGSSTFTLDYNVSGVYNKPTLLQQYNWSINFNNCGPDNFSILNTRFATLDSLYQSVTGFNFNNCGYNGSFNIQDTGGYPLLPERACLLLSGIDNGVNLGTGTISFVLNGTKNSCIVQLEQSLTNKGFVVDISDDSHILEVQNQTNTIIANYDLKSSPHVQISNLNGRTFKLYRGTGLQTLEFSGLAMAGYGPFGLEDYYANMGLGDYRDTLTGLNFYDVGLWDGFELNNTQTFSGAEEINFSSCGTYDFIINDISMFQNIDSVTFSSCAHYYGGFIINDTGNVISTSKAELILTGIGSDCGDGGTRNVINLKLDTAPTQALLNLETALESRTPARKKIDVNFYQ